MDCAVCGTTNEPGRKFCKECGHRLALTCPACGTANAPEDKFCGECGHALGDRDRPGTSSGEQPGASQTPSGVSDPGTERRLVTVLFADLVGSTPLAEGRDPEDVRTLLSEYFTTASEAVERHGGVVEKFIGDAVMAVWGTPVAHEDDAERAVRSALVVVDAVTALGERLGVPLQARVGVLTGEAVAALGAVGQGLVTGDLVNTASRLQSAAEPGTVIVGERTYRAASDAIVFAALDPLSLKGKAEPVAAWRALRVVGEVGGSNRSTAPEPPFVGREEDIRLAQELLHSTGREGRPRLLSVTGVAGIGKTRLLWELQKYIDGITELIYWHEGRCPSYGEGLTFWALAEMVRGRAEITAADDEEIARGRLAATVDEYVSDDEERRWLLPRLGHLVGLDPAPPGERDELFAAWRLFFERVAERGTVVMAFEDLHWADSGLLDFVESLLLSSRSSPILVLSLARPELFERRAGWGSGVRSVTSLHLDPLPDDSMRALVTGYVDGLADTDLERVVARAEGIPLYAVETVRTLADRGVLEQDGSTYRVRGEVGTTLDVPETLHALIAARLDGLPDAERRLVLDASVLGLSFSVEALVAVSGRPASDVETAIASLARKEVLAQDVDRRSAERGQYLFVQSVIREVAYSTLSKSVRRERHLASARWFEAADDESLSGVVANHLLEAYRAEPAAADSEEVAVQARTWLARAAERAQSLGSPRTALDHATAALALATGPGERAEFHAIAARAAAYVGELGLSVEHADAAADAYEALGATEAAARFLTTATRFGFEGDVAEEFVRRVRLLEPRVEAGTTTRVLVAACLADYANAVGDASDALRWSEEALVTAQGLHDDSALIAAASARTWALLNAERHFEASLLSDGVVALAERAGSAELLGRALTRHGVIIVNSDPRGAVTAFMQAADVARRAGARGSEALGLANCAETAIDLGELDTAAAALERAEDLTGWLGHDQDALVLCGAQLRAYRGDPASALAMLGTLEHERRPAWAALQIITWFLRTRSIARYVAGDHEGAVADAREAIALEPSGTNAGSALWGGVQAAAQLRDGEAIRLMLAETAGIRGTWTDDVRASAGGALLALDGDTDAGAAALRASLVTWHERDLPLDHAAAVRIALAVLPPDGVPGEEVERARTYLRSIGADGLLALL